MFILVIPNKCFMSAKIYTLHCTVHAFVCGRKVNPPKDTWARNVRRKYYRCLFWGIVYLAEGLNFFKVELNFLQCPGAQYLADPKGFILQKVCSDHSILTSSRSRQVKQSAESSEKSFKKCTFLSSPDMNEPAHKNNCQIILYLRSIP